MAAFLVFREHISFSDEAADATNVESPTIRCIEPSWNANGDRWVARALVRNQRATDLSLCTLNEASGRGTL
jgi:hypothetical protein